MAPPPVRISFGFADEKLYNLSSDIPRVRENGVRLIFAMDLLSLYKVILIPMAAPHVRAQ